MTGEKARTAGSSIRPDSTDSLRGPAVRSSEWVALPFRNSIALEKLKRAARAEKSMPITAATPHPMPRT